MTGRFVTLLVALGMGGLWAEEPGKKPSILFINIDDLNDWTGTLKGHPQAMTPNLDRLAASGVSFRRAICASPVCFPSRTAMFTGIHPVRSGAVSNFNWGRSWRFYVDDAVTLPKHLEANGWKTFGAGKNFHGGGKPEFQHYFAQPREPKAVRGSGYSAGPLGWGVAEVPYEEMPDHLVVNWGLEQIQTTSEPMFLSLGIYKPHVKWNLPQSSFDKYPLEDFKEPETVKDDLADLPERLRLLAHNEAKFGAGFHERLKRDGQTKAWARAYLAAVTFADEQLGRLLDAWEASPHAKDGIIVLWSDHGFMLGEKEGWGKFKPWMDAVRINLIVSGPGIPRGASCDRAVSLLDLYPTLIAHLGLDAPSKQELDGHRLTPLLKDPSAEWDRPVVMSHEEDGIRYDVVMDNRYRMTRLITGETELYDHRSDPNEWKNLADDPGMKETIERLSKHLTFRVPTVSKSGWLEAEEVPCQTSADFNRRGNFHYPRANKDASGKEYLNAELRKGKGSYIEFVVQVDEPGEYEFAAEFGPLNQSARISVQVADVVEKASQATAEFPMTTVGQATQSFKGSKRFWDKTFGRAEFDSPGLKLFRLVSKEQDPVLLRIDRIKVRKVR